MAIIHCWQVLFCEDDDAYDAFSSADRSELLFHLLKHLIIGGPLNQVRPVFNFNLGTHVPDALQYDDALAPYLEVTKTLYKELVRLEFHCFMI